MASFPAVGLMQAEGPQSHAAATRQPPRAPMGLPRLTRDEELRGLGENPLPRPPAHWCRAHGRWPTLTLPSATATPLQRNTICLHFLWGPAVEGSSECTPAQQPGTPTGTEPIHGNTSLPGMDPSPGTHVPQSVQAHFLPISSFLCGPCHTS